MLKKDDLNQKTDAVADFWATAPWRSFAVFFLVCAGLAYVMSPQLPVSSSLSAPRASAEPTRTTTALENQDAGAAVQEMGERIKILEERERQSYLVVLEGQRKTMDWWFAFLSILTTVIGVSGALLPYLMVRKAKEQLQQDLAAAGELVEAMKGHAAQAKKITEELASYQSDAPQTADQIQDTKETAKAILADAKATSIDKLRAKAVLASAIQKPNDTQRQNAFELWSAVALVDSDDASVQCNAGYWAQKMFESTSSAARSHWFEVLKKHYFKALEIDPNTTRALNNLAAAFDIQAQIVQEKDPQAAHLLWQQANANYEQSLQIDPSMHYAASSCGALLLRQSHARQATHPEEAQVLLNKARVLLEKHRSVSANAAKDVAYNLACVYSRVGNMSAAMTQLEACRHLGELDLEILGHWREDSDLEAVRATPEYAAWMAQHNLAA